MKNEELKKECERAIRALNSMSDWTDDYDLQKDLLNTGFDVSDVIRIMWNALVNAGVCEGDLNDD